MAYLIRHHKAKRSTNREFIVVRFLPAEVAHLLYKYLAHIRRFVDLLERERGFSGQSAVDSSPLLFRSGNAPTSKPWPTGRFNATLKDATKKVWGHAVNSRLLRQLCIGITEKHVQEIHTPFNRFDDTSQTAHRNAVFAWQSGHRPLQRAVTYGLDGAFPTTLQPQLLELYEWASTRWHEFLHLPRKITGWNKHKAQSYSHLGTSTRSLDKTLPFPSDSTKIPKPHQPSNNQSIPMDEDEASDSHSVSYNHQLYPCCLILVLSYEITRKIVHPAASLLSPYLAVSANRHLLIQSRSDALSLSYSTAIKPTRSIR